MNYKNGRAASHRPSDAIFSKLEIVEFEQKRSLQQGNDYIM